MKVWKESEIFITDNRILILTYGSSNCLQLEENNSFFLLYGNQMNQMKSHRHHSLENIHQCSVMWAKPMELLQFVTLFIGFSQIFIRGLC